MTVLILKQRHKVTTLEVICTKCKHKFWLNPDHKPKPYKCYRCKGPILIILKGGKYV